MTTNASHDAPIEFVASAALPAQDGQLLPQREVLRNEARFRSKGRTEGADDRDEELKHGPRLLDRVRVVSRESAP